MLLPARFDYYRPQTLKEACELLGKHSPKAQLMAGGTDLILAIKREEIRPEVVIDISRLADLQLLSMEDNKLRVGAAVSFSKLACSPLICEWAPALAQAANAVGSPQIRNRGTLGGNIATASPAGDSLPALVAHNAEVLIESVDGERRTAVEDLLKDPLQSLKPHEIIKEVQIDASLRGRRGCFVKLGRRNALAIARLSVALVVCFEQEGVVKEASLVVGAVAPYPLRIVEAEKIMVGKRISDEICSEVVEKTAEAVQRAVAGRASAPYKTRAIRGVTLEALEKIAIC